MTAAAPEDSYEPVGVHDALDEHLATHLDWIVAKAGGDTSEPLFTGPVAFVLADLAELSRDERDARIAGWAGQVRQAAGGDHPPGWLASAVEDGPAAPGLDDELALLAWFWHGGGPSRFGDGWLNTPAIVIEEVLNELGA